MNRIVIVSLILGGFLVSGCATGSSLVKKSALIDRGNTKQQVLKTLGPPEDRQFRGDDEAWQYCRTSVFSAHRYVLVWFYTGLVTGVNTYSNTEFGFCSSYFRIIRWEEAPDRTIEIRQR